MSGLLIERPVRPSAREPSAAAERPPAAAKLVERRPGAERGVRLRLREVAQRRAAGVGPRAERSRRALRALIYG